MRVGKRTVIKWLILSIPFIDSFNGITSLLGIALPFSVGQAVRIPILLIIWLLLLSESGQKALIPLAALFLSGLRNTFNMLIAGTSFMDGIKYDIRYIYVLTWTLLLIVMYKKRKVSRDELARWAEQTILIFSIIILLCRFLGIGLTYGESSKGVFIEVNSLTALLVWGCSIWLYKGFISRPTPINQLFTVIVCFATLTQATKTGIIGVACSIVFLVFYSGVIKKQWFRGILFTILGVFVASLLIIYFREGAGIGVWARWSYFFNNTDLVTFLLSGRNQALSVAYKVWCSNPFFILFGTSFTIGSQQVFRINPHLSFGGPEMDFFDIFFYYGIIIGAVTFYYITKRFVKSIIRLVKVTTRKKNYYDFAFILIYIIMSLGGHVLNSPMAGTFFGIAIIMVIDLEKKPLAFRIKCL